MGLVLFAWCGAALHVRGLAQPNNSRIFVRSSRSIAGDTGVGEKEVL
jgi:hypothetical protein